ncbi:MAG: response regulator transcription factor [Lachnospiraceae bacterium]|nr:response regulator transcription factor [Lachnospiraceae bacterium]MBQ2557730.1 response regulator transcription factor [Lachnospiraceae bacterium]MBQ3979210.1 response regulator transcription factor [Lachnospiraceae bacterium]
MSEKIKVILADDHKLLLSGLRMQLGTWDEFTVIGTCVNGQETVEACERELPDIVLMDMQMPVLSGFEATKIIKERHPSVKVVALTTFDDYETVDAALQAGCDGFLLKVSDPEQLRSSLHSVMEGVSVMDAGAMKHLRHKEEGGSGVDLNDRELTVLQLVCKGYTNKEIAGVLSLQPGTVKNIVSMLLGKTFCVSRADLTRYAFKNNLVKPE